MHTYIHTYINTYIHTYIRFTYVRAYILYYTIHTYIHTYILTYIHTYIHACMHTYIRTYRLTYIYIHLHTYIRKKHTLSVTITSVCRIAGPCNVQVFAKCLVHLRPSYVLHGPVRICPLNESQWIHWSDIPVVWMLRRVILLKKKPYIFHIPIIFPLFLLVKFQYIPLCLVVRTLWSTARWNVDPRGPRTQARMGDQDCSRGE